MRLAGQVGIFLYFIVMQMQNRHRKDVSWNVSVRCETFSSWHIAEMGMEICHLQNEYSTNRKDESVISLLVWIEWLDYFSTIWKKNCANKS